MRAGLLVTRSSFRGCLTEQELKTIAHRWTAPTITTSTDASHANRTSNGQPCVRDLRLTVRRVVELVAVYPDRAELMREFPELDEEDIRQALAYAAASLDDRVVELAGNHEAAA